MTKAKSDDVKILDMMQPPRTVSVRTDFDNEARNWRVTYSIEVRHTRATLITDELDRIIGVAEGTRFTEVVENKTKGISRRFYGYSVARVGADEDCVRSATSKNICFQIVARLSLTGRTFAIGKKPEADYKPQ